MGQYSANVVALSVALVASVSSNFSTWFAAAPAPIAAVAPAPPRGREQARALRELSDAVAHLERSVEDRCACCEATSRGGLGVSVKLVLGGWVSGLVTPLCCLAGCAGRCCARLWSLLFVKVPLTPQPTSLPPAVHGAVDDSVPVKRRRGLVVG